MHVNLVLDVLYLIGCREKVCVRADHGTAGEHNRAASSGCPFFMGGSSGDKVLDGDILLAIVDLGEIGTDPQEQKVCHGQLMVHAKSDQSPRRFRLQHIILYLDKKVIQLDICRPERWVIVLLSGFLQNGRTFDIGIKWFSP